MEFGNDQGTNIEFRTGTTVFNAVQFLSYGQAISLVKRLSNHRELNTKDYFMAGAMTGFAVAFIECPVDLFKSMVHTRTHQ